MSGEKGSQIETGPLNFPERSFYGPETRHDLEQTPRRAFGLSRSDKIIYKNKKNFQKFNHQYFWLVCGYVDKER